MLLELAIETRSQTTNLITVWSWKLSRTRELTPGAVTAIEEASRDVEVLAPQYYRSADHSADGCFFFPEPVRGEPVRFPGQCSNVSVVENFNLTAVRIQNTIVTTAGFCTHKNTFER